MVVVHLIDPWPTVRIVLLVVCAWGLIWMVGFLASLKVYPHLLSAASLRVRHGATVDIAIPWTAIASITNQRRHVASSIRTVQLSEAKSGGTDLQIAVWARPMCTPVLRHALIVPTPKGDQEIAELSFLVDDPKGFVARARRHLTAAATRQDG